MAPPLPRPQFEFMNLAVDRKHSRRGKPLAFVVAIGLGAAPRQRHFQRDGPQTLSLLLTSLLQMRAASRRELVDPFLCFGLV